MLEMSRSDVFYVGEAVYFKTASSEGIGLVVGTDWEKNQGMKGFRYAINCNGKVHKDVPAAKLKRRSEMTDRELERVRRPMATQTFAASTHGQPVDSPDRGFTLPSTDRTNDRQWAKLMDTEWKRKLWIGLIKLVAILLFFGLLFGYKKWYLDPLLEGPTVERPNHRYADDALEAIREMNKTTSEHFWKRLVADEKINLSDPSALEGIAHLFVFESTRSNRTILREYVERMPADPPAIFFAFGDSKDELEDLPAVRSLTEGGYKVLLLTDSVDRKALQSITWFEGKILMDVRWYEHSKRNEAATVD